MNYHANLLPTACCNDKNKCKAISYDMQPGDLQFDDALSIILRTCSLPEVEVHHLGSGLIVSHHQWVDRITAEGGLKARIPALYMHVIVHRICTQ